MTLQGYPFRYSGRSDNNPPTILHKYTFDITGSNSGHHQYIVNVEQHPGNLYVVKFHLKSHTDSKWKYCALVNVGTVCARRIMYTCVDIGKQIQAKNELASFGFLGNPTKDEVRKKLFKETKRFKVYDKYARFFFSPDNYEHKMDIDKSTYLLLNKKAIDHTPNLLNNIIDQFKDNYNLEELYSNLIFEDTHPKKRKIKRMWRH